MGAMTTYIGIDPGASGGIALVDNDGALVEAHKMPATETDLWDLLEDLALGDGQRVVRIALEKVHAMPRQGASSTFKFGQSFGMLLGMVVALEAPRILVPPGVWQKALGCMSKGDKNVTKAKAQELWPKHKWTHATADAALIAEWARRTDLAHQRGA